MTEPTRAERLREQAAELILKARDLETPVARDELASMTPAAIVQAHADGRLDHLLGTP